MLRRLAILTGILLVLVTTSVVSAQELTRGERAEMRFLQGMIDHHQMALDMAADCLEKAVTPAVRILCENIVRAQSREILTMRGWLLAWYSIDYEPISMLHNDHEEAPAAGGMMPGDMMGMMGSMAEMMGQMSGMMGMMGGMMQGDSMGMMGEGMMQGNGMGMMQGNGMGMMGGAQPPVGDLSDLPVEQTMHMLSMMNTLTVGELLERSADMDPATPLMDVFDGLMASGSFPRGMSMPGMGRMTHGQLMGMVGEMRHLTLADVEEMIGHLDDGEDATMMTMMMHHMESMAAGNRETPAQDDDHAAHHPETDAAQDLEQDAHAEHQPTGPVVAFIDPPMTMGMFAGLNRLTGTAYEIAWLEAMIDHHDDAIHMAERLLPRLVNPELEELAQAIINDQSAEVEAMEALLVELENAQ